MSIKRKNRRGGHRFSSRYMFLVLLILIGTSAFLISDYSPFVSYGVTDDAVVDVDYQAVNVNGIDIWSTNVDAPMDYWVETGRDSINFDADPIGVQAVDNPMTRERAFSPEVGALFGTPTGLLKLGEDNFVEYSSAAPYGEVVEGGYRHINYRVRFTMFVSTFGDVVYVTEPVTYSTENGYNVVSNNIPTTRTQQMEFTFRVTTTLSDNFPADTIFKVSKVVLGPRPSGYTHIVDVYQIGGGDQLVQYETFSDPVGYPSDKPFITGYDSILVDYTDSSQSGTTTDSYFTIRFSMASGALYDADSDRWYMRDTSLNFNFDVELELVVNEYADARWKGTVVDSIIAGLPARLEAGIFETNPFLIFMVIALLAIPIVIVSVLLSRKTREGTGLLDVVSGM